MKAKVKNIFIIVFMLGLAACQQKPDNETINGQPIYYKNLHNKWVVINYWADWCEPCLKEMPALNQLYKTHHNIIVLGVNFDEQDIQRQKQFAQKLNLDFPLLVKNPQIYFALPNVTALPTTFVINPEGQLAKILVGPKSKAQFEQALGIKK